MLTENMQNVLDLLGISVEEADEMFRICDYEKAERILPRLLAEGLVQGLRPVTGYVYSNSKLELNLRISNCFSNFVHIFFGATL